MFRHILHRIVSYKKRIGRYVIKVEYLDGAWWTFVFVDAVEKHQNSAVVYVSKDEYKCSFAMARKQGLNYIAGRV